MDPVVSSWRIEQHDTIPSTMIHGAACAAHLKPGEKVAIIANAQTHGQGRRGRVWQSPPGNLYASIVMPMGDSLKPFQWGFAVSCAVINACIHLGISADDLRLKWPNDVTLGGGKVAGFLMEVGQGPNPTIILGVGLNIAEKPWGISYKTACLQDFLDPAPSPLTVLSHFLTALDDVCGLADAGGFSAIRSIWLSRSHLIGDPMTLIDGGGRSHFGMFDGIDHDGGLLLRYSDGRQIRFLAGDVSLIPAVVV